MTGARRIERLKGLPVADLRLAKIASIACPAELQGYREGAEWSGRALSAAERAALTWRAAELQRRL